MVLEVLLAVTKYGCAHYILVRAGKLAKYPMLKDSFSDRKFQKLMNLESAAPLAVA